MKVPAATGWVFVAVAVSVATTSARKT